MLCTLCPRRCNATRTETSGAGFCGLGTLPVVARAARHLWEEPCISGTRGSGTVFFSGCSLGCVFCQNEPISHRRRGARFTVDELSELFARVEALGVHNLNLVTPTHFAPAIFAALRRRKPGIPVVWNSGGYETPEMVAEARGLVDVFLPDLKFYSPDMARMLCGAADYFDVALRAVEAMCAQTGAPEYDADGLLLRGTLVRHLVLPGLTGDSLRILDAVAERLPAGTPVSLMRQYTPMPGLPVKGLDRRLTAREYRRVRDHMLALGLSGYEQARDAADAAYTPAFLDAESTALFPHAEAGKDFVE